MIFVVHILLIQIPSVDGSTKLFGDLIYALDGSTNARMLE